MMLQSKTEVAMWGTKRFQLQWHPTGPPYWWPVDQVESVSL